MRVCLIAYDFFPGVDRYSGEQLFRGLVLADGPVVGEFAELEAISLDKMNVSSEEKAIAKRIQDRVIAVIAERDPQYFTAFKAKMTSGDNLQVQSGINEGVVLAYNTTLEADNLCDERNAYKKKFNAALLQFLGKAEVL